MTLQRELTGQIVAVLLHASDDEGCDAVGYN